MLYLYLDESGDLGFDFINKKPSKFFTITILAVDSNDSDRQLINAVKITLRRKLNKKGKRKRIVEEARGTNTILQIKKYFFNKIQNIKFSIYSITLNKRKFCKQTTKEKAEIYNYVACKVLDQIFFDKKIQDRINLIIDKSKSKPEIKKFNLSIRKQLKEKISFKVPLNIYHLSSIENYGLQIVDLFCWGIFQKYEHQNKDWFNIFSKNIIFDEIL